MNEIASSSSPPRPNSASPPPKCAICLGTCTNKCFSDSCMHQFCFTCLLEWSKVKAECPLCKQPFKSIIHNIKSNNEYDEHFIATEPADVRGRDNWDAFMYLPPAPSRHFQFRTTFTVDQGGELAIQQMLLSHPLTNTMYNMPGNLVLPRQRYGRPRQTRRASSATSFRRSIYMLNMWVYAPPDITGRYRDISPQFYRENPAARNRLVPWLNRELNALLRENTQQVMHLVDVIMDHLMRWHIRSRSFKELLQPYLAEKTAHFIHEFYNFMRSPYDMIGYDRHIVYTDRPYSPTYSISDQDDDSDVAIVNISQPVGANNNPFQRPTIEVIEITSDSSHDSDVIIGETPAPEIVNLVDSDSSDTPVRTPEPPQNQSETEESEVNRKPILPLKIRLKHKRQSREKRFRNKKCCSKRCHSSSSASSSSSTDSDSTSSSDLLSHKHYKRKHKYKKVKSRNHKDQKSYTKEKLKPQPKPTFPSDSNSSDDEPLVSLKKKSEFDSDDNLPLSKIKSKEKKKKLKKSRQSSKGLSKSHTVSKRPSSPPEKLPANTAEDSKPSCSRWKTPEPGYETAPFSENPSTSTALPSLNNPDYSFPESEDHYKYKQANLLPQFENIPPYDALYSSYGNCRYDGTVGNRYYETTDYNMRSDSYTPPISHNSMVDTTAGAFSNLLFNRKGYPSYESHLERNYNYDNKMLYPQSTADLPSRVNVGVGTSPVKSEVADRDFDYYTNAGTSRNRRLQSVIVKKEQKDNAPYSRYFMNSSDSDS